MMKYQLEENIKHGEAAFPVCLYNVDYTNKNGSILPCHWHDEFEILYLSKGSAVFHIGEKSYKINEGQFLFINSGELHSADTFSASGCIYHALVFHPSFLSSVSNDYCQSMYINPILLKQRRLVNFIVAENLDIEKLNSLIIDMMEKLKKRNIGFELYIKGSLFQLLSIAAESGLIVQNDASELILRKEKAEKIKIVIDYISANYSKKIILDELAEIVGMSKYNFCRFFKGYTKMTPIEYLNHIRINEACRLLQSGSCSVTDAAFQSGFESMSYFSKIFRKYKNIHPSKLKNN